jgi:Enoyl-CoA hydratase/carnithine racemase
MMLGEKITAKKALEYGLVNEIMPRDKLFDRARELGEQLAKGPRIGRRMLAQTLRMPIKEQIAKELRTTFGTEMWNMLASQVTHDEAFAKTREEVK